MKKLYLTSVNLTNFNLLTDKPLNKLEFIFIPTAADPYEDKWFVEEDKRQLNQQGITIQEIDIKRLSEKSLIKIRKADILYFSGGNCFYLLEKVKESGLDEIIKELIEKGTIYAGASAGAVLACPTIEPLKYFDKPEEAKKLETFEGLNLVDFVVLPHYGNPKYQKHYTNAIKDSKKLGYKSMLLTDNQVIIVKDDKYEVVNVS